MGRLKEFAQEKVLYKAKLVFGENGYEATSILNCQMRWKSADQVCMKPLLMNRHLLSSH
ncbi:hypothetical protein [Bacillus sp. NSP9.1]|uniref:hypothetical protein n=1 Tax=Bacillus sp. NSP9.1 TaxID=1071078 RepID=UPI00040B9BAA|nr:hypothetical protein [Bacillus sp. NSP9.1]QHZ47132.1 hypothetical protein M654_012935 [Bacillus sp. NSP9.1]